MVTDPLYGVEYDPSWRAAAGLKTDKKRLGKVDDNRADWREAWALFPGSVAYVWHAGRYASTVQQSLEAVGFDVRSQIIWAKDRFALSRGHYHWQHELASMLCEMVQLAGMVIASSRRSGRFPPARARGLSTARRNPSNA
jgi:DNA modification methylase